MKVPHVPDALTGLASQLKHGAVADVKAAAGKAAAAAQSLAPTAAAAMRQALAQYDVTDITPGDFSKLIQQMSQKGAISPKDMQELSSIRVDLENAGVAPDESVNLLQFYRQQIAKAQAAAAQSPNPAAAKPTIDALAGRLNWLEKFAAVRQQGGQAGLDAVA